MKNRYGYTWRERLADWISGGALSGETQRSNGMQRLQEATRAQRNAYSLALQRIHAATKDGKSGTARMVARMAREALK